MPIPMTELSCDARTKWKVPRVVLPRSKTFHSLLTPIPGFAPISVDGNDVNSTVRGFTKRILADLPIARDGFYDEFEKFVDLFCECYLIPLRSIMNFEEWLKTTSYSDSRKEQLRKIVKEIRGLLDKKKCRNVKCFTKREAYDSVKEARLIMSRIDEFKVIAGPIFKSIEEVVYASLPFAKHMSVEGRIEFVTNMKDLGFTYMSDYTAYESHFVKELKESCEFRMYRYMTYHLLGDTLDTLLDILSGRNTVRTRAGVKLKFDARRCSGEMDTSLGNGWTNLLITLFIIWKKTNCSISQLFEHYQGIVEGDDHLFTTTVPLLSSDYNDCGMTIKLVKIIAPTEGSFCGLIFNKDKQIIRDPHRFIRKFGWAHSFFGCGMKTKMELQRAKALSAVYETPHCPIVAVLARLALKKTRGCVPRYEDKFSELIPPNEMKIPAFAPTLATRELFSKLYDISIEMQLLIEKAIVEDRLQCLPNLMPPTSVDEWFYSRYVET